MRKLGELDPVRFEMNFEAYLLIDASWNRSTGLRLERCKGIASCKTVPDLVGACKSSTSTKGGEREQRRHTFRCHTVSAPSNKESLLDIDYRYRTKVLA